MTPPADLSALRALVEAVDEALTGLDMLGLHIDDEHCSACRTRVRVLPPLPAAREALDQLEARIARLEEALTNVMGALLYSPVRLCLQCVKDMPCDGEPTCSQRDVNHQKALMLVHAALEGRDE